LMLRAFATRVPDSKIAHEATGLARRDYPPFLFNHCIRTFWFADAIAENGSRFDREIVYLAAILHDLGVLEPYDLGRRFEVDGAQAARDFLLERAYPSDKADLVWDAIALHTSLGIADYSTTPEIALVCLGAFADAAGLGVTDLDPGFVRELIEAFPRLDFPNEWLRVLIEQVKQKPSLACNTFMEKVGKENVPGFTCPSVIQSLGSNTLDTKR
ncbi:MAG: HD domain-containing protein, partial [Pseudonocardiaceae bacterium]